MRRSKRLSGKFFSSPDSGLSDEEQSQTRATRSSGKKQKVSSSEKSRLKLGRDKSPVRSCGLEPKTPRSSSRLKKKANRNFTLPSRESVLDDLSSPLHGSTSTEKARNLKPRKLINNFVRERSSYNADRDTGVFTSDSEMSDFIVDDDVDNDNDEESFSSDSDEESEQGILTKKKNHSLKDEKANLKSTKKRAKKSKGISSSDENESSDIPLSKLAKKLRGTEKLETSSDDDNLPKPTKKLNNHVLSDDSESESLTGASDVNLSVKQEELLNAESPEDQDLLKTRSGKVKKKRKINAVVESSESESGETQTRVADNKIHKSDSSESDDQNTSSVLVARPHSKRLQKMTKKQEEKHNKLFSALIQKRKNAYMGVETKISSNLEKVSKEGNRNTSEKEAETDSDTSSRSDEKVENMICENGSEMDEDESDREFVVADDDDDEESDTGMNSERESEFLQLLNLYSKKIVPESDNGTSVAASCNNYNGLNATQSKNKKRKKMRKWRRVNNIESEESEDDDHEGLNNAQLPLHSFVWKGSIDDVTDCLKRNPGCICDIDPKRKTALHLASALGYSQIVKILLENGADRNACDSSHLTAAAYAADGHPECLALLLDHTSIKCADKIIKRNNNQMSLLHFAVGNSRDGTRACARAKCLQLMFSHDKKATCRLLHHKDYRGFTPLEAAVYAGQHECVAVLLERGSNPCLIKTENDGTLLHFAVECASQQETSEGIRQDAVVTCLRHILNIMKSDIEKCDINGFTALMYACESGNADCVKVLLENGASVLAKDKHGTSSLHLAAMCGSTECVQLLLDYKHQVDCLDKYGWPPLLYANFKAHESCVLALMKPNPRQIFVLGNLLGRSRNELEKKRTLKVVRSVLVSLANHDAYYTVFNDFIRAHPEMLDEHNVGLLQHTWRAILDFDNKCRWFWRKLEEIGVAGYMYSGISLVIDREDILGSAMQQIGERLEHSLRKSSFNITFKDEPGICTGPKREFFSCFGKDIVSPERGIFMPTDDSQYSPLPISYFASYSVREKKPLSANIAQENASLKEVEDIGIIDVQEDCTDEELLAAEFAVTSHTTTDANLLDSTLQSTTITPMVEGTVNSGSCSDTAQRGTTEGVASNDEGITPAVSQANSSLQHNDKSWSPSVVALSRRQKMKQLRFIGRLVGAAICQKMLLNLHLSKPFVKQILGISLSHPEDLGSFDHELHKNAVTWVLENSVESLDLPFSIDVINPWNKEPVTIPLDDKDVNKILDDSNKRDYVKLVSQFKLETSIKEEVTKFAGGLHEVIPKDLLSLFTADEFSLLLNGVTKIDMEDWKRNTDYYDGPSLEKSQLISWFWSVVEQLKEEEKVLLVQFTTGTPCVPIGGFAKLQGLGGPTRFTIMKLDSQNKIPQASTCFNLLKLSNYDTEKQLREKLLIAIRHGAEGFSFG